MAIFTYFKEYVCLVCLSITTKTNKKKHVLSSMPECLSACPVNLSYIIKPRALKIWNSILQP